MRYYRIVITTADGKVVQTVSSPEPGSTYTSFVNGKTLPGALNVELDIFQSPYHTPSGSSYVRVWGISLQEISQALDLNGKAVAIFAGMQSGLPLANPAQAGLLISGVIGQAFGNWVGINQTLDLIIQGGPPPNATGTPTAPKNIVIDWKQGTPLSQAIAATLKNAWPKLKQNINISQKLVLNRDAPGYYESLFQFADYVSRVSQDIAGPPGVAISIAQDTFNVFDGTTQASPKELAFVDLIGQPTWQSFGVVQATCVLRADLNVGDFIKFPPNALVTTQASSFSQFRDKSAFQGTFIITHIHHVGNFRQPSGESWATIVDAAVTG